MNDAVQVNDLMMWFGKVVARPEKAGDIARMVLAVDEPGVRWMVWDRIEWDEGYVLGDVIAECAAEFRAMVDDLGLGI